MGTLPFVCGSHAPNCISGTPVTYDANGNTTGYDVDGAGPIQPRSLTYDLENRPLGITRNSIVTTMAYGPDGERVSKSYNGTTTWYMGGDTELSSATSCSPHTSTPM